MASACPVCKLAPARTPAGTRRSPHLPPSCQPGAWDAPEATCVCSQVRKGVDARTEHCLWASPPVGSGGRNRPADRRRRQQEPGRPPAGGPAKAHIPLDGAWGRMGRCR